MRKRGAAEGLGVVGGFGHGVDLVDGNEWIQFVFSNPAANVRYRIPRATNIDMDDTVGDAIVKAFGTDGKSLGAADWSGSGVCDVSSLFGNALIARFTVTAAEDAFTVDSVRYTECDGR